MRGAAYAAERQDPAAPSGTLGVPSLLKICEALHADTAVLIGQQAPRRAMATIDRRMPSALRHRGRPDACLIAAPSHRGSNGEDPAGDERGVVSGEGAAGAGDDLDLHPHWETLRRDRRTGRGSAERYRADW
ncbi:hypothetical protein GCM10010430_58720 [Kitasatospora cystarginea]|uniref:UspA domain-containing protein n=1 Tax=Kitasatospora cystarginea TaxID=58350 RepID=A0ABN3EPZ3_9ACTN